MAEGLEFRDLGPILATFRRQLDFQINGELYGLGFRESNLCKNNKRNGSWESHT